MEKVRLGPQIPRDIYERLVYLATSKGRSFGDFTRELLHFVAAGEPGEKIVRLSEEAYIRFVQGEGKIPPTFSL
jgi:aminopeptidase-like protein